MLDLDRAHGRKERMFYSCNLLDFALVAGGHNFRPESHTRRTGILISIAALWSPL